MASLKQSLIQESYYWRFKEYKEKLEKHFLGIDYSCIFVMFLSSLGSNLADMKGDGDEGGDVELCYLLFSFPFCSLLMESFIIQKKSMKYGMNSFESSTSFLSLYLPLILTHLMCSIIL